MVVAAPLEVKSLRQQVYDFLRQAINQREVEPGSSLDLKALSQQLGISRTPLRDALIQLEAEGFVTILPRRGVVVNRLGLDDVRHIYEIVGALEGAAVLAAYPRLYGAELTHLGELNQQMEAAVDGGDFDTYYERNLAFHDLFLERAENPVLHRSVTLAKQRLYDFPRRPAFLPAWERSSIREHATFVELLAGGRPRRAADYLRDVHWSFTVQQPYILRYYFGGREPAAAETSEA